METTAATAAAFDSAAIDGIVSQFSGLSDILIPALIAIVGIGLGIWVVPLAIRKLKSLFKSSSNG